jgi:predicted nucleic acid-binding protein
MSDLWVLNASPIIVLAKSGHIDILPALVNQLIIPHAVATEILAGRVEDPARKVIEGGQFNIVETPSPPPELLAWDLGTGETAVLAYAIAYPGCTAIIDDAAARKCARSFSIDIKGTLAVVIMAKQRGFIHSAAEIIQSLIRSGFHIDDQTIREALINSAGENWPIGE